MTIQVSVVVPTHGRPELLHRCLAALLRQAFDPAAYEIIVADDAASPQTRQVVDCIAAHAAAAGPHTALRYLPVTQAHGPAAARNAGWRAARGQIVAFTDDDCLPEPGWLAAAWRIFNQDGSDDVAAASGCTRVPVPPIPTDYERNATGLGTAEFVTANCFCRRDVLAATGGFDERFTAAWREDSDLYFRLLEEGRRVVHAPDAVVVHPIRPAPWAISLRQQRKSLFNALLYKKHPALYRRLIQPAPPWHYYRIVAALLASGIGVLRGLRPVAAGGICAWLWLTARFCAGRLRGTSHAPGHVAEMIVTSALIPPIAVFWRIRGAIKFRVVFL